MKQTFEEYVKEFLSIQLGRARGLRLYVCDMGTELYRAGEKSLPDDVIAHEMIFSRFPEEAGEFMEYALKNYGSCDLNPFKRPADMFRKMVEEACDRIMMGLPYVQDLWDDEEVLSMADINEISNELAKSDWGGFESC